MITLFGSLAGFISSFMPELFNFLKDTKDKEHELKIIHLQIEAMKTGQNARLEEVYVKGNATEAKYLYNYMKPVGIKWVDTISALVRPLITYSFFLFYIILKLLTFYEYGGIISAWNNEDQAIFSAVIGFWFGARSFGRYRYNGHNGNGSNGHSVYSSILSGNGNGLGGNGR